MSVRMSDRFQLLVAVTHDSARLIELERRLSARACRHRRRIFPQGIRLLVARRDFDIAFRLLLEYSAELAPSQFPGFVPRALRPSAVEG